MRRLPNDQQSFPDEYSPLVKDLCEARERSLHEVARGYVSFTIWETKKDFTFWRKGPAFKEAHGGGGILDWSCAAACFMGEGLPVALSGFRWNGHELLHDEQGTTEAILLARRITA